MRFCPAGAVKRPSHVVGDEKRGFYVARAVALQQQLWMMFGGLGQE